MRLGILLLCAASAWGGKLEQIRARGKLVVSVKNDAARPHKDPAHTQKRELELWLARALAKRLLGDESKLELRILARPVRLAMLGTGSVDLVISMIPVNAENQRSYALSNPYFAGGVALMTTATAPRKPSSLAELAGTTVAVLKQGFNDYGVELQRLAERNKVKLTTRYYPDFDAAADAVARGEAAAMVSNYVDLQTYMKHRDGFRLTMLERRPCAVAVQKSDADLLALVNSVIDELKRSGELQRAAEKQQLPWLL